MNESSNPIVPVTCPPVAGLPELRSRHSTLLQRQENRERQLRPSPEEILGFLETARRLGRMLSDFDQRETAQGIMDYWTAKLLSQVPQAADRMQSFYLDDFDESNAGSEPTEAEAASVAPAAVALAAKGDEILKTASSKDCDLLRKLMLRLFRLKEKSIEVYSVPLLASDPVLKDPDAQRLLNQIADAGLVCPLSSVTDSPSYQLGSPRLLFDWEQLKKLTTERRGFRELARGWDKGGRQAAALLHGGHLLRKAEDYSDLDDIETAFLAGSRRHKENQWKVALAIVLGVVCVIVMIFVQKNRQLKAANDQLQAEKRNAESATLQLQNEKDKLVAVNAQLQVEKENVEKALEQLQRALKSANAIRQIQMTTNVNNSAEYKIRQETIQKEGESLDKVQRDVKEKFSPYKTKF